MIFLKLLGKMILFPGKIILFFRRKMKDDLSQKNTRKYDIFFKCSEKMVFLKNSYWNITFLAVLSGKIIFLFLENMILFFRRKSNGSSFSKKKKKKKIHGNIIFPSNAPKGSSFQKKLHWNMIFLVLSGKMIFFSRKYDIFSLNGK